MRPIRFLPTPAEAAVVGWTPGAASATAVDPTEAAARPTAPPATATGVGGVAAVVAVATWPDSGSPARVAVADSVAARADPAALRAHPMVPTVDGVVEAAVAPSVTLAAPPARVDLAAAMVSA